jgi:hypothetical protein
MSVMQALGNRVHELPGLPAASPAGGNEALKAALRSLPPLPAMPQVRLPFALWSVHTGAV